MPIIAKAETGEEVARLLEAGRPEVAALIAANPAMVAQWSEEPDVWPDVLLRSPLLPGGKWRVHDMRRPQPPVVTPPMAECAGAPPPADAVTLYGGRLDGALTGPEIGRWTDAGGTLTASATDYSRIASTARFGDVQVHLEFRSPAGAAGVFQYRGNSGLFLMGLYEVQILDSFENPTYPDGMMGALYGQVPPLANAALPPGRWQCLDVIFTAPRFASGRLLSPARATVIHNGVVIQANAAFLGPTRFAERQPYKPHADALPIELQDHGDGNSKVSFRNFWARPLPAASQ